MKRAERAHTTAAAVATQLFDAETAIDQAMVQIAGFAQSLPAASQLAGFSAVRGQGVYERLAEAMVAQSQVRAKIVEVHGLLADLKADSFMRTVAIGGGTKDTPPNPPGGIEHTGRLALVAVAG